MELVPAQLEKQLALLEPFMKILECDPLAAIPDDHPTGAVVSGGDDPLEVAVLQRVILDVHGQPFVGHVVRRTLRYGPRG